MQIYDSLDPSLKCPRRYVSFIQTFSSICGKKTQRISEQQERIQVERFPFFSCVCLMPTLHFFLSFRLVLANCPKLANWSLSCKLKPANKNSCWHRSKWKLKQPCKKSQTQSRARESNETRCRIFVVQLLMRT